jgi:hypothetical protein
VSGPHLGRSPGVSQHLDHAVDIAVHGQGEEAAELVFGPPFAQRFGEAVGQVPQVKEVDGCREVGSPGAGADWRRHR